jgi:7-carboxy-7-deazaguanine synthase
MKVNEIFESIQGESSWAGLPMIFVRLTGCNLNCSYCDTLYAKTEGIEMTTVEIVNKIFSYDNRLIEFTGGEPLLQQDKIFEVIEYIKKLDPENDYHFLIETNGSIDPKYFIEKTQNYNTYLIADIKMPSSNEFNPDHLLNIIQLRNVDEVKFVCQDDKDLDTAFEIIKEINLGNALISSVFGKIEPSYIVKRILKEKVACRFQLQMHKYIWNPSKRGV